MRENKLKQLWEEGKTAINAWLTIPNAWTAETMAHIGFDAVTIDMQHGLADYQTTLSMLQAISTTDAVPLARVPWNEPVTIMRLLDAGVYGLVCPMINSREEAEAFLNNNAIIRLDVEEEIESESTSTILSFETILLPIALLRL